MAKKLVAVVKLQIPAGKANPAPPVGPALGQHGVNIMDFCKNFNYKTAKEGDAIIPVEISVYADRSYTFITKTPPVAFLLKKAAGIAKGNQTPGRNKVGKVTMAQIKEIAEKTGIKRAIHNKNNQSKNLDAKASEENIKKLLKRK